MPINCGTRVGLWPPMFWLIGDGLEHHEQAGSGRGGGCRVRECRDQAVDIEDGEGERRMAKQAERLDAPHR